MHKNYIFIDRWMYSAPDSKPDEEGNNVIISKKSFGPLEIFEWGMDCDNNPYERYEWAEDDFFAESSYMKNITSQELLDRINSLITLFSDNELSEWALIYNQILDRLKSGSFSAR